LSWPVKKKRKANTLSWPVKKKKRKEIGQHVELAGKKNDDE
jgi:hypothetical protein